MFYIYPVKFFFTKNQIKTKSAVINMGCMQLRFLKSGMCLYDQQTNEDSLTLTTSKNKLLI